MINVTKTFLPPIEDYQDQLKRIWENQWITNNGELYKELTTKLKKYLKANYVIPMSNGTLPIQIALNAFAKGGEVITTPFSYVATTASIVWEACTPVFVDIHPEYLTIDEAKIEAAITSKTTAILATHVYGNPCNVEAIAKIGKKHNLKVIYDAAHCFGVRYKSQSIFNFGDVSTCSFHATKLFHTGEGGALFCNDHETWHEMYYRHNFGHNGPENYHGLGINAKMNELQAAFGILQLKTIDKEISKRKIVAEQYRKGLTNVKGIEYLYDMVSVKHNYSYFPIYVGNDYSLTRDELYEKLKNYGINGRRYFYPLISDFPMYKKFDSSIPNNLPNANKIANKVICLPMYPELKVEDI